MLMRLVIQLCQKNVCYQRARRAKQPAESNEAELADRPEPTFESETIESETKAADKKFFSRAAG